MLKPGPAAPTGATQMSNPVAAVPRVYATWRPSRDQSVAIAATSDLKSSSSGPLNVERYTWYGPDRVELKITAFPSEDQIGVASTAASVVTRLAVHPSTPLEMIRISRLAGVPEVSETA